MRVLKNKASRNLILSGCLAFALCFFPAQLSFAEKRGADIFVTLLGQPPISGELLAVREDSLILMDTYLKTGKTIDFKDIISVRIVRKAQVLLGALAGFLAGSIISSSIKEPAQDWNDNWVSGWAKGAMYKMSKVAVTAGITGVGALVGGAIGEDKTIFLRGRSPLDVKKNLWKLRSKARMPEAR